MWWLKGSLLNNPAWKVPMFFLCLFSWLKSNSKVCTWKWMVRIRSDFLLGQFWPIFGGEVFAVSFRERIGSEWPEHPLATAEVGLVLCALIWPLDYQGRCRGFLFVSKRCHPKIPKSLQWNFVERFDSRKGKTYPKVWKKNSMEVMWFEKIMWKLMRPLRVLEYNFDHLVPKLVILLLDLEVS